MYSLSGSADPVRTQVYRSFAKTPTAEERSAGEMELRKQLAAYNYAGQPLPDRIASNVKI